MASVEKSAVKVAVRVKPSQDATCWEWDDKGIGHKIREKQKFGFDCVFGPDSSNEDVFGFCKDIVMSSVNGYNGCVFAYGQTSSGKTYTMSGRGAKQPGLIQQAIDLLFAAMKATPDRSFNVSLSYMEIYNEKVRDLLSSEKKTLNVREHLYKGVFVEGLEEVPVSEFSEVVRCLDLGESKRSFGATTMNEQSSRSHTILRINIESVDRSGEASPKLYSTLNLIDLAGSERPGGAGKTHTEGVSINSGLLYLGLVITKLAEKEKEKSAGTIPYRNSILTRILQSALGGNSKTAIIATITPAAEQERETHSTLAFAARASKIVNPAEINIGVRSREIEENKAALMEAQQANAQLVQQLGEVQQKLETERSEYKAAIAAQQKDVDSYKKQMASELERSQFERTTLQTTLDQTVKSLTADHATNIAIREQKIIELERRLEQELEKAASAFEDRGYDILALQEALTEAEAKVAAATEASQQSSAQLADQIAENQRLSENIDELQDELQAAETDAETQEILQARFTADAQSAAATAGTTISELRAELVVAQDQVSDLRKSNVEYTAEITALTAQLNQTECNAGAEVAALTVHLHALQAQLTESQEAHDRLTKDASTAQHEHEITLATVQEQLCVAQLQLSDFASRELALSAQIDDLTSKLQVAEESLQMVEVNSQTEAECFAAMRVKMQQDLAAAQSISAELQIQLDATTVKSENVDALTAELAEVNELYASALQQIESLKSDDSRIMHLEAELSESVQSLSELASQLVSLQENLAESEARCTATVELLTHKSADNESLTEQIEKLATRLSDMEATANAQLTELLENNLLLAAQKKESETIALDQLSRMQNEIYALQSAVDRSNVALAERGESSQEHIQSLQEQLRVTVEQSNAQISELQARLTEADSSLQLAEVQSESFAKLQAKLQKEVSDLQSHIAYLQSRLDDSAAGIADHVEGLTADLNATKAEVDRLQSENQTLRAAADAASETTGFLFEEKEAIESRLDKVMTAGKQQLADLEADKQSLSDQLSELTGQYSVAVETIERLSSASAHTAELQARISELELEDIALRSQLETQKKSFTVSTDALRAAVDEKAFLISDLTQQVTSLRHQLSLATSSSSVSIQDPALQQEVESLRKKVIDLQAQLQSGASQSDSLVDPRVFRLQQELLQVRDESRRKISALTKERDDISLAASNYKGELDSLRTNILPTQSVMDMQQALREEVTNQENIAKKLKGELTKVISERNDLKDQAASYLRQIDELKHLTRNAQLDKQRDTLEQRFEMLERQLTAEGRKSEYELNQENVRLKQKFESLKKESDELKLRNRELGETKSDLEDEVRKEQAKARSLQTQLMEEKRKAVQIQQQQLRLASDHSAATPSVVSSVMVDKENIVSTPTASATLSTPLPTAPFKSSMAPAPVTRPTAKLAAAKIVPQHTNQQQCEKQVQ